MIEWIRRLFALVGVAAVFGVLIIAAQQTMDWAIDRQGWADPPIVVKHILVSFFALAMFGIVIGIALRMLQKRHEAFTERVIEVIQHVGRGDYTVDLPMAAPQGPLGDFVSNIKSMTSDLRRMEQLRQEFISNVSHDLQTPLTSMRGFARTMIDEQLDRETQLQYLSIIESECTRLSALSSNLLQLTSLKMADHAFDRESIQLDEHIRRQILAFEPLWIQRHLMMDVDFESVVVDGNPDQLNQVWANLIDNAIKFTPDRGRIHCTLTKHDRHAVFTVTDTGIGISEEDGKRIFERFFRADKARSSGEGSGLGLAIVYEIVELHGGTVSFKSELGVGTEFAVTLPI